MQASMGEGLNEKNDMDAFMPMKPLLSKSLDSLTGLSARGAIVAPTGVRKSRGPVQPVSM